MPSRDYSNRQDTLLAVSIVLMKIREIDPQSEFEINLVAQRMRQTLVEVLGEEKGVSMYTIDWLIDRVRWHLHPQNTNGRVFLSENEDGKIIGHAIARVDLGSSFGYFSTIFVEPSSRKNGVATDLMKHVEDWFLKVGMPKIIYNTANNHVALIGLFKSQGYNITHTESEMVRLTKVL
jgi:GNAT superfamily N-acetyltransferase